MSRTAILWVAVSSDEQAKESKASIPQQIDAGKHRAQVEGWQVIDTLISDGHSRSYVDIHDLAYAARQKGIRAFDQLIHYLKHGGFDVLWCRDADRLGRSQSIVAYITEHVAQLGASIYSEDYGYVDAQNNRIWSMVKGYESAHYIDDLKRKVNMGHKNRIDNGLPLGLKPIRTHRYIYDEHQKPVEVVLKDGIEPEFNKLAHLLIHGDAGKKVAWVRLEKVMFKEYGYGANHKPHRAKHYYSLLFSPMFWGHLSKGCSRKRNGKYRFEAGHDIPDGCHMVYDIVPSVYTGELKVQVKDAIFTRMDTGGRGAHDPYRYTGLCICAVCGGSVSLVRSIDNYAYMRCTDAYKTEYADHCTNKHLIPTRKIDAWLDKFLSLALDQGDTTLPTTDHVLPRDLSHEIQQTITQITELETKIDGLIELQLQASDAIQARYIDMANEAGAQLQQAQQRLAHLQSEQHRVQRDDSRRLENLSNIRDIGLSAFWDLSQHEQNNILSAIFQDHKLVLDKDGVCDVRRQTKQKYQRRGISFD